MGNKTSRWRNAGLWISLASGTYLTLKSFGIDLIPMDEFTRIVECFISAAVFAGIISNPKEGNFYSDKQKQMQEQEEIGEIEEV